MNGYTNSVYTLPAICLDEASSAKLDKDMVTIIADLIQFHPYDAFTSLKIFGRDMEAMSKQCGLNTVASNLNADLAKKGSWWVFSNMLLHSVDIESYLIAALTDLAIGNLEKSGKDFGIALRYVVPPPNSITLLSFETPVADHIALAKGLVDGLEGSSQGPCYSNIMKLSETFMTGYGAFEKVMSKNLPALDTLIAQVKLVPTQFEALDSTCHISSLFSIIGETLTTKEGLLTLYKNYYKSLKVIDTDIHTVINCSDNFYNCGKSAGNAIDLLFNWNLEYKNKAYTFLGF